MSDQVLGNAIVFGYYDTRSEADGGAGLTDNYFTITNTSDEYVQGHLRVRTGTKSIELLDFDVVLTPYDVFAFDLYQLANGHLEFASCDTHTLLQSGFSLNYDNRCWIANTDPDSELFLDQLTAHILTCDTNIKTHDAAVAETLKGYVDFIGEGTFMTDDNDPD